MKSIVRLLRNRKIIIISVVFIIAGFAIWKFFGKKQTQSSYQTAKVERGTIISSISASGQILNSNNISINTQASGIIKKIYVKDGDAVTKGDKILEISLDDQGQQRNAQSWSSYLSAKNSLDSAQTTAYTLQSDMFTKWDSFYELATSSKYQKSDGAPDENNRALPEFHISQKNWLAAEAKYKNQQSVIAQAQVALNSAWLSYQLSSSIITAPADGTLNNLTVVEGMNISGNSDESQQIAVIQNEYKPLASFSLSEVDVTKVKSGQKATITLDSISGKTFTGKIMTVDKIGSVTSGVTSYPIIIQFDNNLPQILPNMTATANIIIDSKNNVFSVPSSAVQISDDQSYVRMLKNGVEQRAAVETGLASDSEIEIVTGLKEGDEVIIGTLSNGNSSQGNSPFSGTGGGNMMRFAR